MPKPEATKIEKGGACPWSDFICCPGNDRAVCAKCGWNPGNSGLLKRRVKIAMREYQRKLDSGEALPPYW